MPQVWGWSGEGSDVGAAARGRGGEGAGPAGAGTGATRETRTSVGGPEAESVRAGGREGVVVIREFGAEGWGPLGEGHSG